MAEPKVLSKQRVWINSAGKEVPPPTEGIPILGWGGSNQDAQIHEIITYENGQIWSRSSPDGGKTWDEPAYMETDPQLATQFRSDQKAEDSAPSTANGYQWNPKTGAYDIPIGGDKAYEPDLSTTARQIWGKQPNGAMGWVENPNYVAPQGPAYSTTAGGMAQKQQYDLEEDAAQSKLKMQEYEAQLEAQRQAHIQAILEGRETLPVAKELLDQWTAQNTADYQAHAKRVLDIEEYNRKLPQLQAQEDRAARADQRATNEPKIAALEKMGAQGKAFIDSLTNAGVGASEATFQAAYNPYESLWRILNEEPAQGPRLTPQEAPPAFTPRPMPALPGMAPAAPGAAPVAPAAPYGGDPNAQAAFEGQYPASEGYDPQAIWREQDARNRAPAAR